MHFYKSQTLIKTESETQTDLTYRDADRHYYHITKLKVTEHIFQEFNYSHEYIV